MQQPGFGDLLNGTRGLSFDSWTKVNARSPTYATTASPSRRSSATSRVV